MVIKVLKAPAGSGKTQAYVNLIASTIPQKLIEVYVPTIKLAEEIKRAIDQRGTIHRVSVIKGRDQVSHNQGKLCQRHILAKAVISKGVSVFPTMCMQRTQYGTQSCPHYDYCDYIAQYHGCNVRIYTHAHLLLERTMLDEKKPDLVVIDEDFTQKLVEQIDIPFSLLSHVGGTSEFQASIQSITKWIQNHNHTALLTEYQQQGSSWADLADKLKKMRPAVTPGDLDQTVHNSLAGHRNVKPVATLLEHMDRVLSKGMEPSAIDIHPDQITVHHRHEITRFGDLWQANKPMDLFVTDATISEMLVRQCIPVDIFEEHSGKRNAIVVQCSDSICSTSSLDASSAADPIKQQSAVSRLSDVQALVDELANTGIDVLVVGPSKITGNQAKSAPAKLTAAPNVHLAHFGAVRGIDAWKNCEALVLIGRNEPPVKAVENIARALFYDDPTPLQLTGQWEPQTRGFDLVSGEQLGVDILGHKDPRVNEVLLQVREAESIQALDRLRLIHNVEPKLVILLSKLPLPGVKVDRLLPLVELTRGGEFEQLYRSNGGVLPMNATWIAQRTGKTTEAAKKAMQRLLKRGHPLLRFSTWRKSPLAPQLAQYRPVGQRSWSKFFFGHPTLAEGQQALETLLGTAVTVKP